MSGPLRRALPPPRHRPSILAVIVRWRVELALLASLIEAWLEWGPRVVGAIALATTLLLVSYRPARVLFGQLERTVVIPHRVRSGFVQAGVASRDGRLPWIVGARPLGADVLVHVWLRAGTTVEDVEDAASVIAGACGATEIQVLRNEQRPDRLVLCVVRPMWGRW